MNGKRLDAAELRRVAVHSNSDPRTVKRRIEGQKVRTVCAMRIDAALAALGYMRPPALANGGT